MQPVKFPRRAAPPRAGHPPHVGGKRRPLEIYMLVFGALAFSAIGWLRVQQAVIYWDWIASPAFPFPPVVVAAGGGAWGGVGLAAAAGLWFRARWAAAGARGAAVFFSLTYWLDRLLFTRSAAAWANWGFALALTGVGLAVVFGALALERQKRYLAYRREPSREESMREDQTHEMA